MAAIHRWSVVVRGLAAASAAVEAENRGCYTQAAYSYGDIVLHSMEEWTRVDTPEYPAFIFSMYTRQLVL